MEFNEPAVAYYKRNLTIEEYLEMENAAEDKHEYYKGEIFAMSGAKLEHNIVCVNLLSSLKQKLKGKPCQPFGSDLRIHIPENTLFTYPDISVICGKPESLNNDEMNFLNPTVIFEVYSHSTKKYDREPKFRLYLDIPTLREYVLVDPTAVGIESFYINSNGNWELKDYNSLDQSLLLSHLQVSLDLKDIYEGTKAGL